MRHVRCRFLFAVAMLLMTAHVALAQRRGGRDPHIGYAYPAGGRVGTTVELAIGGQYLDGATRAVVSGQGVQGKVVKHIKIISQRAVIVLRDKVDKIVEKMKEAGKTVDVRRRTGDYTEFLELAREQGFGEEDLDRIKVYQQRRADKKRQENPQLEETVIVKLVIDQNAPLGNRELRLLTPSGLSNTIVIQIDELPEYLEKEPNDTEVKEPVASPLPVVLNGQIMPGDVDRFRFEARRGTRLVVVASARELVPYLADAVPGWFQATLALYDADGHEVAYDDDFQFHPDPVLFFRIPKDGSYELEIKDSIFRGREDFVYRIKIGKIPFITSIFPLGGQQNHSTEIALQGWNLPEDTLTLDAQMRQLGIHDISLRGRYNESNRVPFIVEQFPECLDQEPNNTVETAQKLKPPLVVNGRIDKPGDWDVFRFEGRAGGKVMLRVQARHLNSPLDSVLVVTDANGRQLAYNDDYNDRSEGLTTHHADSRLLVTLPADGAYFVHLGDTQKKGGVAYAYRLRITPRIRDFLLRAVPATINARPGARVPVTMYALREDDFKGDIRVTLKDPPPGFELLSEGIIPADQEKIELVLSVPDTSREESFALTFEGHAVIKGQEVVRPFVPAEDRMQAFLYRHLVPAQDLLVTVSEKARRWSIGGAGSGGAEIRIPAGGFVRYQLALPDVSDPDAVQVVLRKPPTGITIRRVVNGPGGLVMLLAADGNAVRRGNLKFDVFVEQEVPAKDDKPASKKRVPVGKFPSVSFEVVGK